MKQIADRPTSTPMARNGREPWRPRPAEWVHAGFHPHHVLGLRNCQPPGVLKAGHHGNKANGDPTHPSGFPPASRVDAGEPRNGILLCAACLRVIGDGSWRIRIEHNRQFYTFCRPRCAEAFHADPGACVRRIETLNWIENHPPSPPEYSPLND